MAAIVSAHDAGDWPDASDPPPDLASYIDLAKPCVSYSLATQPLFDRIQLVDAEANLHYGTAIRVLRPLITFNDCQVPVDLKADVFHRVGDVAEPELFVDPKGN